MQERHLKQQIKQTLGYILFWYILMYLHAAIINIQVGQIWNIWRDCNLKQERRSPCTAFQRTEGEICYQLVSKDCFPFLYIKYYMYRTDE